MLHVLQAYTGITAEELAGSEEASKVEEAAKAAKR